jgi:membrane protein
MRLRDFPSLLSTAAAGWNNDNAPRLSAALAYYSLFSLAPLLIIAISLAGLLYGEAAAKGQIAAQMRELAGAKAADAIQALVLDTSRRSTSLSATIVGLVILLFGASSAFSELKSALNTIWGVTIKPGQAVPNLIRERCISFAMVFSAGFLLLVSLIVSTAITALEGPIRRHLPLPPSFWQLSDVAVSLVLVTLLFAMIFRVVPNVKLRWRDVWLSSVCTAFLFTLGKFLIGIYLGRSGVTSYYGAAGSAVIILLWVYYSACILFFGAELTKACVQKYGAIQPAQHCMLRNGTMIRN